MTLLSIDTTSKLRFPPGLSSDDIQDISFHPKRASLAIASSRDVFEYDIGSCGITSHFPSDGPITHLRHCNDLLISALRSGEFCTWNLKTGATQAIIKPTRSSERRPVRCLAVVADMQARVVYVREGMKEVRAADVLTGTVSRVASFKKAVTVLATHPTRGLGVAAAEDGTVKVFSGRTGSTKLVLDAGLEKGRKITWVGFVIPPPVTGQSGGQGTAIPWVVVGTDAGQVKVFGYAQGGGGRSGSRSSRRVKSARLSIGGGGGGGGDNGAHRLLGTYTPFTPQPVTAILPYPLGPSSLPCMLVLNNSGSLTPIDVAPLLFSSSNQHQHSHPLFPASIISPFQLPLRNAFRHQSAHHARFAPHIGVFTFVAPLAHPHLPLFSITDNTDRASFLPTAMRLPPLCVRPDREENGQEVFNVGPAELIYVDPVPSASSGIAVRISSYSLYARQSTLLRTVYPFSSLLSSSSSSSSSTPPTSSQAGDTTSYRLIRSVVSPQRNYTLLFFQHQQTKRDDSAFRWVCTPVRKSTAVGSGVGDMLQSGRDGAFLPPRPLDDGSLSSSAPASTNIDDPKENNKDAHVGQPEASWYAVLHEDGCAVSIYSLSAAASVSGNSADNDTDKYNNNNETEISDAKYPIPRHVLRLPFPASRIFPVPITSYDPPSSSSSPDDIPYHRLFVVGADTTPSLGILHLHQKQACYETIPSDNTDNQQKIRLRREEKVLDAVWRYTPTDVPSEDAFVAVLTTQRVMVLDARHCRVHATAVAPSPHREPWAHSLAWAGPTVLYNTPMTVCALPMYGSDSDVQEVCTIDDRNVVLCGALPDRIVFLRHTEKGTPEVAVRYVNLLETLLIGLVRLGSTTHTDVRPDLRRVVRRFEVRVGTPTLETVARHGYGSLALQIADAADITLPTYTHYRLATAAGNLSLALDILRQEQFGMASIPESPRVPQSSPCYPYVVELGRMAVAAEQYAIAAECFDMTDKLWELLQIYAAWRDMQGLTRLAERCSGGGGSGGAGGSDGDCSSIYLACMRILDQLQYDQRDNNGRTRNMNDDGAMRSATEEEWMVGGVLGPMEAIDNAGKKTAVRSILLNTLGEWMGTEGSSASPEHYRNQQQHQQQQHHHQHGQSLDSSHGSLQQPDFGGEFRRRSPTPGSSLSVDDETHTETDTGTQSEMVDEEGFKVNPDQESMRREYIDTMNAGDDDANEDEEDPEAAQRRSKLRNIQVNMNRTFSEDPDSLKNIGSLDLGGLGESTPRRSKSKSKSKRRRKKQGAGDRGGSKISGSKTVSGSTGRQLALDMTRVHQVDNNNNDQSEDGDGDGGSEASASSSSSKPLSARSGSDTLTASSSLSPPHQHQYQHRSAKRRGSNISSSSMDGGLSTPRSVSVNPSDAMKKAMGQLNKGQFQAALKNINKALSVLVKDTSQVTKKKNILICVRYKLLLTLLQYHREAEKQKDADPQHNALLLVMVAGIPVKSAHRAICYKMAIKANMQCGNNATAARLIRNLLPITPVQYKTDIENKLRQCEERGLTDAPGFPTEASEADPAFCWRTFRLLHKDDPRAVCNYCRGEYSLDAMQDSDTDNDATTTGTTTCPYCTYGRVNMPSRNE